MWDVDVWTDCVDVCAGRIARDAACGASWHLLLLCGEFWNIVLNLWAIAPRLQYSTGELEFKHAIWKEQPLQMHAILAPSCTIVRSDVAMCVAWRTLNNRLRCYAPLAGSIVPSH